MIKVNYKINSAYSIECGSNWYLVTMQRIRNTPSGNPRYSVSVVFMSRTDTPAYQFNWRGGYCSEPQEARDALSALLETLARD